MNEWIETTQNILSDHNGIEIKVNNRKTLEEPPNIWKLNTHFLKKNMAQRINHKTWNTLNALKWKHNKSKYAYIRNEERLQSNS